MTQLSANRSAFLTYRLSIATLRCPHGEQLFCIRNRADAPIDHGDSGRLIRRSCLSPTDPSGNIGFVARSRKNRKKKGSAKPLNAAAASIRSPASTATGRLNIILERVEEQQQVVIEAVTSNREALERKIEEGNGKLSSRIDVIEIAVRQNSADIRSLAEKLDAKADSARVAAFEVRLSELEATV